MKKKQNRKTIVILHLSTNKMKYKINIDQKVNSTNKFEAK